MKKHAQTGIGLPELLISFFITSLIITALAQHYLIIKQHYVRLQSELDDAMELQLSIDAVRTSIRQAGFTPCLSVNRLITLDHRTNQSLMDSIDVQMKPYPKLSIGRMHANFNIVVLKPKSLLNTNSTIIETTRTNLLEQGDLIMIADCYHAELHTVQHITHTKNSQIIQLDTPLTFQYMAPVYLGKWIEEQFFVLKKRGLFYRYHRTDELSKNITDLSFYDQSNDNDLNSRMIGLTMHLDRGHKKKVSIDTRVRAL